MNKTKIPFGMLFEEFIAEASGDTIDPEYDPFEGLSYTLDSEGRRIPYVTQTWAAVGTQTGTCTKVQQDSEDTDADPSLFPNRNPKPGITGTQTITKVRAETTDAD